MHSLSLISGHMKRHATSYQIRGDFFYLVPDEIRILQHILHKLPSMCWIYIICLILFCINYILLAVETIEVNFLGGSAILTFNKKIKS